jgi:hypothetical protein
MALQFKIGDSVRQVVPAISGKVVSVAIVDGDVQFCVEYEADGESHQRSFTVEQIEAE